MNSLPGLPTPAGAQPYLPITRVVSTDLNHSVAGFIGWDLGAISPQTMLSDREL